MSITRGLKPSLRARLAMSPASVSQLPLSLANTMVSGSAAVGGAAACAPPAACSTPARKPASQARCTGLAGATTRLSNSTSSSENGAVLGMAANADDMAPK
jgi:hypothetical protein